MSTWTTTYNAAKYQRDRTPSSTNIMNDVQYSWSYISIPSYHWYTPYKTTATIPQMQLNTPNPDRITSTWASTLTGTLSYDDTVTPHCQNTTSTIET
jgi:hypothetical protein